MSTSYIERMDRSVTIWLVLVLPVFLCSAAAQEQGDTVRVSRIQLAEPGLGAGSASFLIPPHLILQGQFSSPTFFFEGVPVPGTEGAVAGRLFPKTDLLAPLRVQWAREAELSTFRQVLGSIQLGGVAFLAIRQFTKAGTMTARPRPVRSTRK